MNETVRIGGWRRDDLVLGALLFGLLALFDFSDADLWLQHWWGNATGFVWRDHWFTAHLVHDGGRWLAGAGLLALAINVFRAWTPGVSRRRRIAWLGVTVAGMALMPLLKKVSLTSCPWDLADYGGAAHWVSHWRWGVSDGGAGHCFPSGHASSAVAFLGSWFVLREPHPRLARALLALVGALGLLYGWAQMARGAHYASHTLWSAWICWALGLAVLGYRRS